MNNRTIHFSGVQLAYKSTETLIQLIDEKCDLKLTLINCRFIKPFDENLLDNLIQTHNTFITIEEGLLSGGFGSQISNYFSKKNITKKLLLLGINDQFTEHGTRTELLKDLSLDSHSIFETIKTLIEK